MSTSSPKILITAPAHPLLMERLQAQGYEVSYEPTLGYEALLGRIEEVEGLVVTTRLRIDKAVLNAAEKLNPDKAIPTLNRCAEYGRMRVTGGQMKFANLPRF